MTQPARRIWLITGVSSGLGLALAEEVLRGNDRVVGTVRTEAARAAFEARAPGQALGRLLDISQHAAVPAVVDEIERTVGPIDILVNNAGYLHEGTLEEASFDDIRNQIDTNLLGTLAVTKAALPFMRTRRRGHIMMMSSTAGLIGIPGCGLYCATKFALQGIAETLALELRPFGVHVTVIAPGQFRSEATGNSIKRVTRSIPDYDSVIDPVSAARLARHNRQPGDPKKLAAAIVHIVESQEPPVRFLAGPDVVGKVRENANAFENEISKWEFLSLSTNIE